jgi:pyruvate formate lyase activating enzyme
MLPSRKEIGDIRESRRLDSAASLQRRLISARHLADQANNRTYCVCFFGGDPASQMPHALGTASYLFDRGVTICWETSGNVNNRLLDRAVDYSRRSGGVIKFDIKAFDETLHIALTGVSNKQTLENFARSAGKYSNGPGPPLVIASTLLVPGYVDVEEVGRIARFIAKIHPEIPYSLLAFHPHFYLHDLPTTSVGHATAAEMAAKEAGLMNVRVGNKHLLSKSY